MKSDSLNCLFIHVPKKNGASIEKTIWKNNEFVESNFWMGFVDAYRNPYQTGGLQHLTGLKLRQILGRERFDQLYKFSTVRNPYDRIVSQYKYILKRRDLRQFISLKSKDGFLQYLDKIQKRSHIQWEPQVSFLYDYAGNLLIDKLIYFENFQSDVNDVLLHLNIKSRLKHINASKDRTHYSEFYCDEALEIVAEMYHDDFVAFNYSKEMRMVA